MNSSPLTTQFSTPTGLLEPPKAQLIRAADVVLIGPVMALGGLKLVREHPLLGGFLFVAGLGTIIYNARNWWLAEQASRQRLIS